MGVISGIPTKRPLGFAYGVLARGHVTFKVGLAAYANLEVHSSAHTHRCRFKLSPRDTTSDFMMRILKPDGQVLSGAAPIFERINHPTCWEQSRKLESRSCLCMHKCRHPPAILQDGDFPPFVFDGACITAWAIGAFKGFRYPPRGPRQSYSAFILQAQRVQAHKPEECFAGSPPTPNQRINEHQHESSYILSTVT